MLRHAVVSRKARVIVELESYIKHTRACTEETKVLIVRTVGVALEESIDRV